MRWRNVAATVGEQFGDGERIRLVLSRFIGGGYVAYFVVSLPEIVVDRAIVASWWTPAAVVATFGPGWALLAATFSSQWQRFNVVLPTACGIGYLCALLTWFPAWTGLHVESVRSTWLVLFPGLASLAMVVVPNGWWACLHLVVTAPLVQVASGLGRADRYGHTVPLGDAVYSVAFSAVFVLAGIMASRTGDVLDRSRAEVGAVAGRAAARRARDLERARLDALVHDRVLAVLLTVAEGCPHPVLVQRAAEAMHAIDGARGTESGSVTGVEVASMVRRAVTDVAPDVEVRDRLTPGPGVPAAWISPDVGSEICSAATEAVRNALRHAGPSARIVVAVEVSDQVMTVTVTDDGVGFDPGSVTRDRLGVSGSVVARMAAVGGAAAVSSTVGLGTQVRLRWPA